MPTAQGSPGMVPEEPLDRISRLAASGIRLDREEIAELVPYCTLLDTHARTIIASQVATGEGRRATMIPAPSMPFRKGRPGAEPAAVAVEPEAEMAACLARIAEFDSSLRAFTVICPGATLSTAGTTAGHSSPLRGVSVAIKDVIDVEGVPTTANSMSASVLPVPRDAEVVRRLRECGAVILGKTTTWEYAVGPNPADGPFARARNPYGEAYQTGGSSSGSAVAVAAGMAVGALGTDTGGSIRCPASWCGVVGFKPTHGLVPTEGVMPLAPSLDCVGTLARSVAVASMLFEAIAGTTEPSRDLTREVLVKRNGTRELEGYRLVVWRAAMDACDPSAEVRENFDRITSLLATAGATIYETQLPPLAAFNAACYLIARHESFRCYRGQLAEREWRNGLNAPTRSLLLAGGMISTEEIGHAYELRVQLAAEADAALSGFDAVITPTMATVAPPIEAGAGIMASPAPHFTRFASLTGRPSITIPSGKSAANGLPFGLLLSGSWSKDRDLLRLAALTEGILARAGEAVHAMEVAE